MRSEKPGDHSDNDKRAKNRDVLIAFIQSLPNYAAAAAAIIEVLWRR